MTQAVFWAALAVLAYTYLGFPALILARGRLLHRPYRTVEATPSLTVVIAARNEADAIGARLENLLSLDYPSDLLEVVVCSDGSNDETDEIVRRYEERNVRLLSLPAAGKAAALNAGVAVSAGEILVFSDANSSFVPQALRALVRPFGDPAVGGVAGDQRYLPGGAGGAIAAGERSYWSFERMLKLAESRAGNAIAATGAIYAIRASLFGPIPAGVSDDFVTSTGVISRGHRLVFAPDAVAYEPVAASSGIEFGRKVRVMTRGLRAVFVRRELLNPFRFGFYAVQLFSHKVLRRLMAVPLLLLAATGPLLWNDGIAYRAATLSQAAFYSCGAIGILLRGARRESVAPFGLRRLKVFTFPAFFLLVNAAALLAVWNVLRGRRIVRWEPRRGHADPDAAEASVIIPVNARDDLELVGGVVGDLARYDGPHALEVILVINNYPADDPPAAIRAFERAGTRVVSIPDARREGEAVWFTARALGVRAASSECCLLFDADVRIQDPSRLVDWYVERLGAGAAAAYTHVGHHDVPDLRSVHAGIAIHHAARWIKRVVLRIPTLRGSNYAVNRSTFLCLYDEAMLADDLNVGPTIKSRGGRIAYSGARDLLVSTSARKLERGWGRLFGYFVYRLRYQIRALPVRSNAGRTIAHRAERPRE